MRRALVAAALVALSGCRQQSGRGAAQPHVPKGDVIWLVDPRASADPTLDGELGRIGAAAVFLPAGTLGPSRGSGLFAPDPPPPRPLEHVPTVLVVKPTEALAGALTSSDGPEPIALATSAASALSRLITDGAYGRVAGVHLDFPFTPGAAKRYGALIAALKPALPAGTFVSISLAALPPGEEARKRLVPLLDAADALVAFVFGTGPRVDPIATDALHRPWWAAYDTRVTGEIRDAGGQPRGNATGRLVEPLSGIGRFQFENDLSVNDASVSAFTLTARAPVRQEGLALEAGDRIAFRLPAISEMLYQLGSNLAGKRYALGRAILFDGATESERVFDLAALEDVLLGRSLAPVLEASVTPAGRGAIAVDLVNRSHHASVVSRVDNWVEVDIAPAHPSDVQLGGFDRYEVYDGSWRPVTPGRATTVRLFETLVAPLETVTPARIVARGALPAGCCRYRVHAMSAAGPEVAMDWTSPPAPPTAEPGKASAIRRKK